MANEEHLNILKQGVKVWNKWREENSEEIPDLFMANLSGMTLSKANLREANLREADLRGAKLRWTNLREADLREADVGWADLREADLRKANLNRATLGWTKLGWADLRGTDLSGANLHEADLRGAYLDTADLINTNLNRAVLTGVFLYGTARDDWIIDGVECNFVYWGNPPVFFEEEVREQWEQEHRVPKDRDFWPREFEELYKQLPTFEYVFKQGFSPLDPLIMDRVVQAINERCPDIDLILKNFEVTGTPHATFTILHKDNVEEALKEVTAGYETRLKMLEGQKEELRQVIKMLGSGNIRVNIDTIEGNAIIQQVHGDVYGDVTGHDKITTNVKGDVKQLAAGKNIDQRSTISGRDYHEHT